MPYLGDESHLWRLYHTPTEAFCYGSSLNRLPLLRRHRNRVFTRGEIGCDECPRTACCLPRTDLPLQLMAYFCGLPGSIESPEIHVYPAVRRKSSRSR